MNDKMTNNNGKTFNIHPAYLAVWAAVVASGYLVPTFPIWGTGGYFSLANVFSPLAGVFFGPLPGALCSAIGGFIGSLIAPHTAWIGPFTFIIGATTAFTTGCISWGNWPPVKINKTGNFIINGGIIVYLIGNILWFTQKVEEQIFIWIPVIFYGLGFAALIIGTLFTGKMFFSPKKLLRFPAIWICSFGGLIGGAMIGNFFSLVIYNQPKIEWIRLTVVSPAERALFAFAAMLVGVPLLEGMNKIGIKVGPAKERESDGG